MQKHEFTLQPAPFKRMQQGIKKVEMRLFDTKRQKLQVGDFICFTNTVTKEQLNVQIVELKQFRDFKALYAAYSPFDLGYEPGEEVSSSHMEVYYNNVQIMKFGVLAIRIKLLNSEIS